MTDYFDLHRQKYQNLIFLYKKMSKRKASRISTTEDEESDFDENDDQRVFIPDPDSSGSDADSESDDENSNSVSFPTVSYRSIFNSYSESQKKLEPDHVFLWKAGETLTSNENLDDKLFLSDSVKRRISSMSPVELFELFLCTEMKNYIIEASKENGLDLHIEDLNTFIGILLLSSYNSRNNLEEYWETDPLVNCSAVSSAMSRTRFKEIKSKIKCSKSADKNNNDKAWRIRQILNLFRRNIQQFGFFSTALSVDEMMVRFFGRTCLKQYLPSKPDRYGIKLWALCGANGYLFNLDVYCGKNDPSIGINLASCALGSRVVLQMVNPLLNSLSKRKLSDYHLYFDNYFSSPDLLVHLKKCGLRSTGTVRKDRVSEKHIFEKKAPRGSYKVDHDRNSGMNYISVIDSKQVSILSTATSATPMKPVSRFSRTDNERVELSFPFAFALYNKFMGGVDCHDFRCKKASPSIHSRKWTWTIFLRIIESASANATIIWNICNGNCKNKMKTKSLCKEVSRHYLSLSKLGNLKSHKSETRARSACSHCQFYRRTRKFCLNCNKYYCKSCFLQLH